MIGMVLVTHGRLAAEFVAALEHVVGPQSQIAAVCIGPEDDMEQRRQDILRSIAEVDSGDGAVLLTDMFGGTPSNLAISVMDRGKVEVIAGVNLPMLIKLASLRQSESLERAVLGRAGGRAQIHQRRLAAARGRPPMSRRSPTSDARRPTPPAAMPAAPPQRQDLQPEGAACARRRPLRQDRRAVRRRGLGAQERHRGLGPLDHGADDARRRARARSIELAATGPRRRRGGRRRSPA